MTMAPMLVAAAPFGLPSNNEESSGALVCRWSGANDGTSGNWTLWVGLDDDIGNFQSYGASLEGVMWKYQKTLNPNEYTFRFGRFFSTFETTSFEEAKKLAERKLHEWLKQLTVEVGRLATDD